MGVPEPKFIFDDLRVRTRLALVAGAALLAVTLAVGLFLLPLLAVPAALLVTAVVLLVYFRMPVLEVYHAPERFPRRASELSANVCGAAHYAAKLRYRLNGSAWRTIPQSLPRSPRPYFTIEIETEELRDGENELVLEASVPLRGSRTFQSRFAHDTGEVTLPRTIDWRSTVLDVQDGCWEVFDDAGVARVRPRAGFEGYDRILVVTGDFPAARRIETDVSFHGPVSQPFGFGLLSLWGGHPDTDGFRPRRGWLYCMAWYLSIFEGFGTEFSIKWGGARRRGVSHFLPFDIRPGERYRLVAECWEERAADGSHRRYMQRMKAWRQGEPEPEDWVESGDCALVKLPEREYSVALMAHCCRVDYGPVHVLPLARAPAATSR